MTQNAFRTQIVEDTTRSLQVVQNPFDLDADDPNAAGWYIGETCPINGKSLWPVGPFETRADALACIIESIA